MILGLILTINHLPFTISLAVSYDYEVESLTLNGTKVTIPRYYVFVSEIPRVNHTEIGISFEVILRNWAHFRKVENGTESYWIHTLGPIKCCGYGMGGLYDENFKEDEDHFQFLLKNLKRIDWDKEKGKMTIESKENEMQKPQVIAELKQISLL